MEANTGLWLRAPELQAAGRIHDYAMWSRTTFPFPPRFPKLQLQATIRKKKLYATGPFDLTQFP